MLQHESLPLALFRKVSDSMLPSGFGVPRGKTHAVDLHRSGVRGVQAIDRARDLGPACADEACQSHDFAGMYVEIDILKERRP